MFCPRCGRPVPNNAYACPGCGCYLRREAQVPYPRHEERNPMAVIAFICTFLVTPLGAMFGGIGLVIAEKRNGKGRGLSIASMVISGIWISLCTVALIVWAIIELV